MGRFTDFQAVRRVELSDSDWVDFRSELSFAETQSIEAGAMVSTLDQDNRELGVEIDWATYEVVRLATWISAWSFTDQNGEVRPTRENIRRLSPDTATELQAALDAHIETVDGGEGKDGSGETS